MKKIIMKKPAVKKAAMKKTAAKKTAAVKNILKKSKIDVINLLKYSLIAALLGYTIILFVRAGGDAPMERVREQTLGAVEIKEMKKAGAQDFKKYYGLNANDFDEVVLYLPDGVMSVNELLIVRLRSESQAEAVEQAAQERLEAQKESFDGYGISQMQLLKSAVLESRGSYVFFIVGEDADKAYAAFRKSL